LRLLFQITLVVITLNCYSQSKQQEVTIIASDFYINGETNVNQFECGLKQINSSAPIIIFSTWSEGTILFEGLMLKYQISNFKCEIAAMNKDLHSTLNANEYPNLYLKINDIQIHKDNTEIERLRVSSNVSITLSGKEVDYEIKNGEVINYSESLLSLSGKQSLKMTDFGITPPSKFFGMIQVTDKLDVNFEILISVSNGKK
jgi:hypothetical protein